MDFERKTQGDFHWLEGSRLASHKGLVHGFTLVTSARTDDSAKALLWALGCPDLPVEPLRQIHGARVVLVRRPPGSGAPVPEADGAVTDRIGIGLAVWTADCLPVLLSDPFSGALAAVHAGWRGLLAGVVEEAVGILVRDAGVLAEDLHAAAGPSIGPCCYEVGPEVRDAYRASRPSWTGGGAARDEGIFRAGPAADSRPRLDLRDGVRRALRSAGLAEGSIAVSQSCTSCGPERLPSYRRDGPGAGRSIALIARIAPA